MNQELYTIINLIQQNENLSLDDKQLLLNSIQKKLPILGNKISSDENSQQIFTSLLENAVAAIKLKNEKIALQNRELEIQNALNQIRAKTMAMQKSEELQNLVKITTLELSKLDISLDRCFIVIYDTQTLDSIWWMSNPDTKGMKIKYHALPPYLAHVNAWKEKKQKWEYLLEGNNKQEWDNYLFTNTELSQLPKEVIKYMRSNSKVFLSCSFNRYGYFSIASLQPLTNEQFEILIRFANVFEQPYTRFLDLQKAEAQAREAKIETALEKVRGRAMAMQSSEELKEVAKDMRNQFSLLGQAELETCAIHLWDEATGQLEAWAALRAPDNTGEIIESNIKLNIKGITILEEAFQQYQSGKNDYILINDLHKSKEFFEALKPISPKAYAFLAPTIKNKRPGDIEVYWSVSDFYGGSLVMVTRKQPDENSRSILKKFANVFGLAYKRFLDLQKAEAQAREAQIETALERVRSRSMAMHRSEELKEVIKVVLEQFVHLNINVGHAGFYIDYKAHDDMHIWLADPKLEPFYAVLPYFDTPTWNSFLEAKAKGTTLHTDLLDFKEKNKFYRSLFKLFEVPEEAKKFYMECKGLAVSTVLLDSVGLYIENFDGIPYTEEDNKILMRFGKVFQQTYTRFLDLKKAEAQAKEAQIQLSLERVRARAMAMQKSEELLDVINIFSDQLAKLNIYFDNVSFGINDQADDFKFWLSSAGQPHPIQIQVPYYNNPAPNRVIEAQKKGVKFFADTLTQEENKNWIQHLIDHSELNALPEKVKNYLLTSPGFARSTFILKNINLYIGNYKNISYNDEENDIFKRFAQSFEQAYTRFLDLQRAEANAREAKIEAALEKVRSRTLAMQKSEELAETAAEVFKQLIGLGIEPNRLYIGIIEKHSKNMEMWATDEEGSGIGKRFVFNANENASVNKLFQGWRNKIKSITVNIHGKELEDYIHYLQKLQIPLSHALTQKRRVQSVAYFDKGFIGMASPNEQSENNVQLLERFAAVFNLTFTRFNDLKIAEAHALQAEQDLIEIKAARKKAEEALSELQATQKQLIQSEKMASLGELTAGIAHEIQNPLNFVNNFSEVSNELLEEMKTELEKGNTEEAKAIAEDVKQNLEKILHHGKRADGIVKGMLQHSRSSSGQKEPTDINTLADEYLRLAYHGLRAKDKSFNANIKTDFDENIGSINIVPQDMGRVILNLITNAFYVVSEKKKLGSEKFEPTVSISTKKLNNKIFISIADNGTGIPKNIVDKIFQPFFTTKPTGKGTGLGLSLSYDIVKAHGGEIKLETKEGEGTIFTIQLPANT